MKFSLSLLEEKEKLIQSYQYNKTFIFIDLYYTKNLKNYKFEKEIFNDSLAI